MSDFKGNGYEGRQAQLERQRAQMMLDFENQRIQIHKDNQVTVGPEKFVTEVESLESSLKRSTVGLIKLEDFQRIKNELKELNAKESSKTQKKAESEKSKRKKKKNMAATLSFDIDDEDDTDSKEFGFKKPKFGKDPTIDTSFLPDKEREEEEKRIREKLKLEWLQKQEEIKAENIQVTYSYWDGSGHRKEVECKKGDSIAKFLEKCRLQFPQLRGVNVDNLIYVKEDIIIPHHYTFYDFILNKARGKSGPLFNFDVHEDIRLLHDATIEKDEAHAGKVLERSWYEKNKHIFPASRWEVFDPEKNYGSYKIKDSKKLL